MQDELVSVANTAGGGGEGCNVREDRAGTNIVVRVKVGSASLSCVELGRLVNSAFDEHVGGKLEKISLDSVPFLNFLYGDKLRSQISYINDAGNHGSQVAHVALAHISVLNGNGQRVSLVLGTQEIEEKLGDVPGQENFIFEQTVRGQVVLVEV